MATTVTVSPLAERKAIIFKRLDASSTFGPEIFDFRGGTYTPKIVQLPIDLPVYRMANCRTFSKQQTAISQQSLAKTFFERGQESTEAQQVQHGILVQLAKQGSESVTPIITVLQDEGQREPLLITSTGVVVNGNRRLAAMRDLGLRRDGSFDERFSHVECAVLPADVSGDEIDDIEADLQAKRATKLDYDWIGDAQLLRRQVNKGRTTKQVADRLRRSKNDVENVLQALDEADLYLSEWLEAPGEYERVQPGQQIFGDLPKAVKNKDPNLQNASRAIAWALFENRDNIDGRVYRLNPAFGKLAPKVLDFLAERLDLPHDEDGDSTTDDDFAIEIDPGEVTTDYTTIIQALRSRPESDSTAGDETVAILVDACESAIALDKGKRNEQAALAAISQAHTKLAGVDAAEAGADTLPAMLKQIASIRKCLDAIEERINARLSGAASDSDVEE